MNVKYKQYKLEYNKLKFDVNYTYTFGMNFSYFKCV